MTRKNQIASLTLLLTLAIGGCHTPTSKETHNLAKENWGNTRANVLFSLAVQQFESGDLDKAEKTCAQALGMAPRHVGCLELAARIEIERGRLERGFLTLQKVHEIDPKRSDAWYLMGVIQERWQRYDQALECYDRAYESRLDSPAGLLAAAEMLVKLDRTDEAIARLQAKLDYFPNNGSIRSELGRLHMLRGEYALATTRFREAVVLDPEDQTTVELLAMARLTAGQHAEAIEDLTKLLAHERNADRNDLRLALGDCYVATHRPVQARAIFLDVVRRNENDVNAWIKLGQTAWLVEDTVRLTQAADRVTALAPERHEGYLLRGMIEQRAGRYESAATQFQLAAQRSPNSAAPLLLRGVALEKSGNPAGAADAYRQALRITPDDARAQRLLAGVAGNE